MAVPSISSTEEYTVRIEHDVPIGKTGWFRTGGNAKVLFVPETRAVLADFLKNNPDEDITVLGALSNTIIRDGGLDGITIRLGKGFGEITQIDDTTLFVGAGALDRKVANQAARLGIAGVEFLIGIPGAIGGAVRMNAGCYGTEMKDVLVDIHMMNRAGEINVLKPDDLDISYRNIELPDGAIVIGVTLSGVSGNPLKIKNDLEKLKVKREETQPIREKTGGSTFANPSAAQLVAANLPPDTRAWNLVDSVGGRGLKIGGAQISEKHCNFMINTGNASAADLENLGDEVRRRVLEDKGVELKWEIKRIGKTV